MKKNIIQFKTKAGNEYELTRPTADIRAELNDGLELDAEGKPSKPATYLLSQARAVLAKSVNVDDMSDEDIVEVGSRAVELSTLGK